MDCAKLNDKQAQQNLSFFFRRPLCSTEAAGHLSFSPEQPICSYMEKINSKIASSPSRSAVIDFQILDDIRVLQGEDSPAFFAQIIHAYLDHTPQLLATLHEAAARNDALTLQRTAHSLKSSSAALGAMTFAALCQDLEMRGHQQHPENVTTILAAVTAEYELVREALLLELQRETQP
jgi:HPt (histidine-containing phosphotransfer) domain-containing protein